MCLPSPLAMEAREAHARCHQAHLISRQDSYKDEQSVRHFKGLPPGGHASEGTFEKVGGFQGKLLRSSFPLRPPEARQ